MVRFQEFAKRCIALSFSCELGCVRGNLGKLIFSMSFDTSDLLNGFV